MGVTTVAPDSKPTGEVKTWQEMTLAERSDYLHAECNATIKDQRARIAQLEAELKESNAETAACLAFLSTEMGWEYFRADQLYLDHEPANSQSLNNAEKLRKYLAEKKHGAEFLQRYAAIEADAKQARESVAAYQCNANSVTGTFLDMTREMERLDAELAELRKDKERLDWLWSNGRIDVSDDDGRLSSREAIDAAMGEKAEGK